MKFGDRLKISRIEKGLTQEQVAKIGVSSAQIKLIGLVEPFLDFYLFINSLPL